MHADLWITTDDKSFERVAVYPTIGTPHPAVRIRFTDAAVIMPDMTARALVHALLAHYAGRVDFHLLTSNEVEKVEDGLRVSLAALNREALGLEEGAHPTGPPLEGKP